MLIGIILWKLFWHKETKAKENIKKTSRFISLSHTFRKIPSTKTFLIASKINISISTLSFQFECSIIDAKSPKSEYYIRIQSVQVWTIKTTFDTNQGSKIYFSIRESCLWLFLYVFFVNTTYLKNSDTQDTVNHSMSDPCMCLFGDIMITMYLCGRG